MTKRDARADVTAKGMFHITCYSERRPQHHPDIQALRESCHWDSVILSGIPDISSALAPLATVPTGWNCIATTPISAWDSPLGSSHASDDATSVASGTDMSQTGHADVDAKSMLILGLCGQNHDPQRYIQLVFDALPMQCCSLLIWRCCSTDGSLQIGSKISH